MKNIVDIVKEKAWIAWLIFFVTLIITFVLGLLASSIMERRAETEILFQVKTKIDEMEVDSSKWKENFPREYERWEMTSDKTFYSKYFGGRERDSLEEYPEMIILWAGYGFSKDYMQARGHYYSVTDIINTLRTVTDKSLTTMPGTCWTCKSPDVMRVMNEYGDGNIRKGAKKFYSKTWAELGKEIKHPIGCLDCHDPKTQDLRITRPAIIEGFSSMGKSISKATRNEMRSLVCAQCHSEYYFAKDGDYLTFPWHNGIDVKNVETYYDKIEHTDWIHSLRACLKSLFL